MEQLELFSPNTQELYLMILALKADIRKTQQAVFAKCNETAKDKDFLWERVEELLDRFTFDFPENPSQTNELSEPVLSS